MIDLDSEAKQYKKNSTVIDRFRKKYHINNTDITFVSPSLEYLENYKTVLLAESIIKPLDSKNKMRPDYVADIEYGTRTLGPLLLFVNDCFSNEEFIMDEIYIPDMNIIYSLIKFNFDNNNNVITNIDYDFDFRYRYNI